MLSLKKDSFGILENIPNNATEGFLIFSFRFQLK